MTHTFRRAFLDQVPARRRDLYLTTHNTYNRQTSMPPGGFKPAIPAFKRPQTCTLDARPLGSDSQIFQGNISKYELWRGQESGKTDPQHMSTCKITVGATKERCKQL